MRPLLVAVLLALLLPGGALAFTREEERIERERIRSERAQAEAAYASRERDCRGRFVVTSCIEDAQRDRRQALERLRRQEEVMDEAQRKQRAAQRMEDIRGKLAGEEGRRRPLTVQERLKAKPPPAERTPRSAEGAASANRPDRPASQSAAEETRRRADYERRQQEAKAHREAVEKRNAERAAKGKRPAAPLPVPASAASR